MREIKFRAWDPFNEVMYFTYKTGHISFWKQYTHDELGGNGPILMQYTGLKDKNGIEIYEGDIIEGVGRRAICLYGVTRKFGVELESCFYFAAFNGDSLEHFVLKDKVVIGNRYENPVLLKGNPDEWPTDKTA